MKHGSSTALSRKVEEVHLNFNAFCFSSLWLCLCPKEWNPWNWLFIYQSRPYFELLREYSKQQKKCHSLSLGLLRNLTKIINYSRFLLSSGIFLRYCLENKPNENFVTRALMWNTLISNQEPWTAAQLSYFLYTRVHPAFRRLLWQMGWGWGLAMPDNLGLKILLRRFL